MIPHTSHPSVPKPFAAFAGIFQRSLKTEMTAGPCPSASECPLSNYVNEINQY